MSNLNITEKTGLVRLETLFKGSKSEGLFPVLITEDGEQFRIHIRGNQIRDSVSLANLDGQNVCLVGYVDDIKGHIRIVIDSDLSQSVKAIGQNIELDNPIAPGEIQRADMDKNNIKEKP